MFDRILIGNCMILISKCMILIGTCMILIGKSHDVDGGGLVKPPESGKVRKDTPASSTLDGAPHLRHKRTQCRSTLCRTPPPTQGPWLCRFKAPGCVDGDAVGGGLTAWPPCRGGADRVQSTIMATRVKGEGPPLELSMSNVATQAT